MRALLRLALHLTTFLLAVANAFAEDAFLYLPVPPPLLTYVEAETGYPLPPHLTIGVVDNDAPLLMTRNVTVGDMNIVASAAEVRGQIYIPTSIAVRLQEPRIQALVVHELIHVAQETNGRAYACDAQREAEAYTLQNKFLDDAGLPAALDVRVIAAFRQCKSL